MTRSHLDPSAINQLLQCEDITVPGKEQLISYFRKDKDLRKHLPDGMAQIDPRSGERILYSSSRSKRPHDNRPNSTDQQGCVICAGQTTGILDLAPLSRGFTFINKNLYPILFPPSPANYAGNPTLNPPDDIRTHGLHFLQWTSSYHDTDWHNLPPGDQEIVMDRLAALEGKLFQEWPDHSVSIIKNGGYQVGGSLAHGHQQILMSSTIPRGFLEDHEFQKRQGEEFSTFLLRVNPGELTIRDYGPAVLMVPYFMRRPFDMILLLKDPSRGRLHHLSDPQLTALARGWHDALKLYHRVMPDIGKEIAYNVTVHNGTGCGLYCEFLPFTQASGGYEHLGLSICHTTPPQAARKLREAKNGL